LFPAGKIFVQALEVFLLLLGTVEYDVSATAVVPAFFIRRYKNLSSFQLRFDKTSDLVLSQESLR
jgi:hypothetical protein